MTKIPFVDLGWQHRQIEAQFLPRLQTIFAKSAYTMGEDVTIFEENFARYLDVNYVVGVDNGTDALTLAYSVLGLKAGDEIITIPTTYIATISAAMVLGIKPVLVDIDAKTRNFDLAKLEQAITSRTKAIVPVHLYGDMADMDPILEIARRRGLFIIEDAAQAQGARYKGKRAGSLGDIATFSFYPAKNLGAYGQAGAIATNDEKTRNLLRDLRNQGEQEKYRQDVLGYNTRLDTVQAAVLDEKLKHLDEWNGLRRAVATQYDALLLLDTLRLPPRNKDIEHIFHLYVVELLKGSRDALLLDLAEKGIGTGIHYPIPVHLVPATVSLGYQKGDFPVAERYADRIFSLPMFPGMTPEQVATVGEAVLNYVRT